MKTLLQIFVIFLLTSIVYALEPVNPDSDPFKVGSLWKGTRKIENFNGDQPWQLLVKTRSGDFFSGTITMTPHQKMHAFSLEVTGTVPASGSGQVKFETIETGGADQRFWGIIKEGALKLDFKGRSRNGNPILGEAWLSQ